MSAPEYDPATMGRPEDGEGLTRHRVEDGPDVPADEVILVPPERDSEEE